MVTLNYRLCDLQPHSACLGCLNNQQYYSLRYLNFVNIVAAASVVHVVRGGSAEPRHDIHGSVVRAHCDTSLTLYSVAWFSHTERSTPHCKTTFANVPAGGAGPETGK